jgi:hypothetical protein
MLSKKERKIQVEEPMINRRLYLANTIGMPKFGSVWFSKVFA